MEILKISPSFVYYAYNLQKNTCLLTAESPQKKTTVGGLCKDTVEHFIVQNRKTVFSNFISVNSFCSILSLFLCVKEPWKPNIAYTGIVIVCNRMFEHFLSMCKGHVQLLTSQQISFFMVEYMLQVHLNDLFFFEFTFSYTAQWSYNSLTICLIFCQIFHATTTPGWEYVFLGGFWWHFSCHIYPNDTLQRSWWNLATDSWDTHTPHVTDNSLCWESRTVEDLTLGFNSWRQLHPRRSFS